VPNPLQVVQQEGLYGGIFCFPNPEKFDLHTWDLGGTSDLAPVPMLP